MSLRKHRPLSPPGLFSENTGRHQYSTDVSTVNETALRLNYSELFDVPYDLVEVILSAGSVLLEVRLSSARIHVSIREDDEELAAEVAATLVGAEAPDDEVTSDAELDEAGELDEAQSEA